MGSDARETSESNTSNVAVDASSTNGSGVQILDSIIVDPSDQVLVSMVDGFKNTFATLMGGSSVQLDSLIGLGNSVLELIDSGNAEMAASQRLMLQANVAYMQSAKAQGKEAFELARDVASDGFDLAELVATAQDGRLSQALEIVSDASGESKHIVNIALAGFAALAVVSIFKKG
ncbi:TPA_inf: hypothetical protein gp_07 [Marinomonas phage YY]|nr:TPA_inf: hypothetical protein gp_07 [Marinomonas phage YY]